MLCTLSCCAQRLGLRTFTDTASCVPLATFVHFQSRPVGAQYVRIGNFVVFILYISGIAFGPYFLSLSLFSSLTHHPSRTHL